jgi:GxxExxY protein
MSFSAQQMDHLTDRVIGAAIEVHCILGPGLLESAYEECLSIELAHRGIPHVRQVALIVSYKGTQLKGRSYRLDFVVERDLVLEIKAQDKLTPIHSSQLLSYIRLGGYSRGLLINFGEARLADGVKRVVNNWRG